MERVWPHNERARLCNCERSLNGDRPDLRLRECLCFGGVICGVRSMSSGGRDGGRVGTTLRPNLSRPGQALSQFSDSRSGEAMSKGGGGGAMHEPP